METNFVRELVTEVPINDAEWYTVIMSRDERVESPLTYKIDVFYEDDDTIDSQKLIGGTSTFEEVPGEALFIETRAQAVLTFNIVVRELLALVHLRREPIHPLLTALNNTAIIEEARKELEDLFYIVIE